MVQRFIWIWKYPERFIFLTFTEVLVYVTVKRGARRTSHLSFDRNDKIEIISKTIVPISNHRSPILQQLQKLTAIFQHDLHNGSQVSVLKSALSLAPGHYARQTIKNSRLFAFAKTYIRPVRPTRYHFFATSKTPSSYSIVGHAVHPTPPQFCTT